MGFNKSIVLFIYKRIFKVLRVIGLREYKRKIILFLGPLFMIMLYILSIFIPFFIFQQQIFGEGWLKVDLHEGERVWVDTSHWETKKVLVKDGYYEDVQKKRWVDTSYTVKDGYYATGQYRVWVEQKDIESYTASRYVDTSHYVTKYRYINKVKPVNFTVISGTDNYGWSVYAFAAKTKGMQQVSYRGSTYMANVYVIDYRPARGGRIYAVKYVFIYMLIKEKQYYMEWEKSGHWESYTAYRRVDNSHWETRTGRYWVDTSYKVNDGHWEDYNEKAWVDTSYYEFRNYWVDEGFYTEPLHGKLSVQKNPKYVFTRWHKDERGKECGMDLKISWELDNSMLAEGQEPIHITGIYIYEEVHRYRDRGIEEVLIYNGHVRASEEGDLETFSKFDFAGSDESILHIYLYAEDGQSVHAYFSNPVNGYRSINMTEKGTESGPERWLGGNEYGEISF